MALTITKETLASFQPCDLDKRLAMFGRRKSLNVAQAVAAGATVDDILWVAGRMGRADLCVRFALLCAQKTAHLNSDPRVQAALDATAAWLANPCEETRAEAARSAAEAAEAARSAAWSEAAEAARSARSAAWSARSAAWSAEAAWSARSAAWSAAWSAAEAEMRQTQIQIALEVFA
jgi:hypothetical protein